MYAQDLMQTRLIASVLVLLLSVANSGAALVCTASCMSSWPAARAAMHHHEMETNSSIPHVGQHSHYHGPPCAQCPKKAENSVNQSSDCTRPSEIQARSEGFFSIEGLSRVTFALSARPTDALGSNHSSNQSFLCGSSPTGKSFGTPLLPLRI